MTTIIAFLYYLAWAATIVGGLSGALILVFTLGDFFQGKKPNYKAWPFIAFVVGLCFVFATVSG